MCKYKDKVDEMRWSFSRLSAFEQCKYNFYLQYILKDFDNYLPEGNFWAENGSFVHEVLAKICDGKLSPEEATEYFLNNYDENVLYETNQKMMDNAYEKCANYFAETDFDLLNKYEILGVELEVNEKIRGYDFIGFIDLLLRDKETKEIIVVDHKSSAYPFTKSGKVTKKAEQSFESYKRQMYLYCYQVKEMFGEYPTKIVWNHFKDGKLAVIEFCQVEFKNTLDWFENTINQIREENEYEGNEDWFYCHNLCDFRNSCEYNI